jgi:hypothetical protein
MCRGSGLSLAERPRVLGEVVAGWWPPTGSIRVVAEQDGDDVEQVITRHEAVLRELIRSVLGSGWTTTAGVDLDALRRKQAHEAATRRGATVSADLLDYVEHRGLGGIITKSWQDFAGILGDKKRWDVYCQRIADLRNAPMHGRTLLRFERQLLVGMTGEIANIVAQHRSSQGPDSAWYPVIESVVDSYGNVMGPIKTLVPTRLTVGETVTLTCVGRDPQDRPLHWGLRVDGVPPVRSEATGSSVTLSWTVERQHVSEAHRVYLSMWSDGEFHREGGTDDLILVQYAVNPPL